MRPTWFVLSMLTLLGSCASVLEARKPRAEVPPIDQLDRWLAEREGRVPGLRPGVAAGIVWAHPDHPARTPLALVYLPGYTATRGEISPVAETVAAALGANLYFARPTGQGVGPEGHRTVTAADWVADGLEAWDIGKTLGERVVVIGVSTGGTLATWLTLGPSGIRPAATVLISPNLTPTNRQSEMLLWPGSRWLLAWMRGDWIRNTARNELQARFWDLTHHSQSLIPMMQLVDGARTRDFSRWPTPVLVAYDPKDTVVDEEVTVKLFSKTSEAVREFLVWHAAEGDDHHVLAGEALSPSGTAPMVSAVLDYLSRVLALSASP